MKYLLSILGVLSTFLSFSQSLTPQEVVAYLNKIAHENPPTDNYVHTFTLNGGNLKVDYGEVKKVKGKDTIVYIDNLSKEIDLNAYKISRAKVEGSIVCQELMKVEIDKSYYNRVSQVLPVNVDEYLNKVPVYLLYDCNSSSVLDIFEDGIKYLTTLLKREGGSPKVIPNPFRVLSADNSDINIKMSNINGNWFFNSSIAGENVRFIFDSGASECTLSQSVFSKLFATDSTLFSKVVDGLFRMADEIGRAHV